MAAAGAAERGAAKAHAEHDSQEMQAATGATSASQPSKRLAAQPAAAEQGKGCTALRASCRRLQQRSVSHLCPSLHAG